MGGIVYIIEDDTALRQSVEMALESFDIVARSFADVASFLADIEGRAEGFRLLNATLPDFLTKPFSEEDLLNAVKSVMQADKLQRLQQTSYREAIMLFEALTPRELQIMELVAEGKLSKQIAYELGISLVTVKIHRSSAMKKLKAKSMADFIRISDRRKAIRQMPHADRLQMIGLQGRVQPTPA